MGASCVTPRLAPPRSGDRNTNARGGARIAPPASANLQHPSSVWPMSQRPGRHSVPTAGTASSSGFRASTSTTGGAAGFGGSLKAMSAMGPFELGGGSARAPLCSPISPRRLTLPSPSTQSALSLCPFSPDASSPPPYLQRDALDGALSSSASKTFWSPTRRRQRASTTPLAGASSPVGSPTVVPFTITNSDEPEPIAMPQQRRLRPTIYCHYPTDGIHL